MNLLVVADVHGCSKTLKTLVRGKWNPHDEFLIFVGDLVNKGPKSAKVIEYVRELQTEYPYSVFVVRGNHEQMLVDAYDQSTPKFAFYEKFKKDLLRRGIPLKKTIDWMRRLPLKWENKYVLVTHAGVALHSRDPFVAGNLRSVLHNRSALKNVGKLQIFGHVIQEPGIPRFYPSANAWGIDTGCWRGGGLHAIRMARTGEILEFLREPTHSTDL